VRVKVQEPQTRGHRAPKTIQASHQEFGQFGSAPASRQGQANRPEKAQVRRQVPKVGRNEPCPCGSGKKYKHCCGR
jgi:preprotein translocase subunit SecA